MEPSDNTSNSPMGPTPQNSVPTEPGFPTAPNPASTVPTSPSTTPSPLPTEAPTPAMDANPLPPEAPTSNIDTSSPSSEAPTPSTESTPPSPAMEPNPISPVTPTPITGPNALPPETAKPTRSAKERLKPLIIILCILTLSIVALVVTIVVLNNRSTSTPEVDAAAMNGTSTNAEALADAGWTNAEELAKYNAYQEDLDLIIAKAQEMVTTDPPNTAEIYKMFELAINNRLQSDQIMQAIECFKALVKLFNDNGMKEEALNAYSVIDLSRLPGYNLFYLYGNARDLARELGNEDKATFYEAKRDENTAAWEQEVERVEENNARKSQEAKNRASEGENNEGS